jgi:prepilin-type N-terminal cleavage/methylation domain-containing protein
MFKIEKKRGLEMKLISVRQETRHCHSEPFTSFRTGSAKNETICHPERERRISRFFVASLLRMTWRRAVSGWTLMSNQGFTLLEVLAAIAILSFGLLAVATMQGSSIKGNSQAIGTTEGITVAQDQIEKLLRLPYNDADLDDIDGDGTDANPDPDGANDNGCCYGLDDTVDGALNVIADKSDLSDPRYKIYWNIAVDVPIGRVKTVRVIVLWEDRGVWKNAKVDFMKSDII